MDLVPYLINNFSMQIYNYKALAQQLNIFNDNMKALKQNFKGIYWLCKLQKKDLINQIK